MMHFTRETMTVLAVLTACACRPGRKLAFRELTDLHNGPTGEVVKSILLLLRHELLHREPDGRVMLAINPASVTLGGILRLTQPDLLQWDKQQSHRQRNVFSLAVEAASVNFVRMADQFTLADLIADHPSGTCHAA
ncbi:hypothetical protein GOZ80_10085 [Agrobacterium vitis]|uniref:Siderophore biosynthesis protein n=2 Tax=Agrobacterium vitis TaxID=373 RepID=A0A109CM20_AGRVI|nr:hypothetical protein [Agrobacterium vitis]KAA3509779.1 hypothetical protein DXM22_19795 [Agrobacterium vitis]KAA3523401.1 hypothetical protein DXT89_20845 [Agrobacterium vitis]MCF1479075.1 hypothetical protein [Agrobacterium vitis]MUO94937.1 hypothetical protein [Agrobacterium vitis]MUZ73799.1 hypothetical protein [Agrobacterium vitis]